MKGEHDIDVAGVNQKQQMSRRRHRARHYSALELEDGISAHFQEARDIMHPFFQPWMGYFNIFNNQNIWQVTVKQLLHPGQIILNFVWFVSTR